MQNFSCIKACKLDLFVNFWFNFCQACISVNVLWTWVSWRRLRGLVFHQDTGAESGRFSVDIFLQVVEMRWWRGRERSTLDMSTSTSTTKKRTFIKIHSGENYFSNLLHSSLISQPSAAVKKIKTFSSSSSPRPTRRSNSFSLILSEKICSQEKSS